MRFALYNFNLFPVREPDRLILAPTVAFKLTDQEVVEFYGRNTVNSIPGAPKIDLRGAVDGQRKLTIHRALPTTSQRQKFELRNRVVGIYDKGNSGTSFETQQRIVDTDSGEVYATTQSMNFVPRQGNWGGPRGKRSLCLRERLCIRANRPAPGPKSPVYTLPSRDADARHEVQTTKETVFLYR